LTPEDLERMYLDFLKTATALQSKYKDRIQLLIGIETDFVTRLDLDRTKAILDSRTDIQYVVGSVHHVAGVSIDFDKSTYLRSIEHCTANTIGSTMTIASSSKLEMPQPIHPDFVPTDKELLPFLVKYLDAQYEMIESLEPEVIGHFDLCLLFNPGYRLDLPGREEVWNRVERNIKRVVGYGGLFEANGAAIRKGWETSYPSKEVLRVSHPFADDDNNLIGS
jgi:histidinol-phosphatase (PHP family)